ncbi:Piwi-domain-containing protein [Daedalea quercina L-15889]|uniref:Piwi-domain-containing protein n=1 Tax=Daedalea quercina L-15889 TaxID=1314783 RepID=A0A165Q5H0_9APHY|nr:Piwi-domain-containing protein [Daedalea quercina L-15889]
MATAPARKGTQGHRLQVKTNSFLITLQSSPGAYIHYDDFNPTIDKSRRAFEIIDQLQISEPRIFNPRAVFDGRRNLFAKSDTLNGEYEVHMSNRPGKGIFKVKLMRVSSIEPANIQRLMASGGAQQGENTMALNLLQIVVRQATNMRHGFAPDARAFFVQNGSRDMPMGLQAWHGYFQSVRPVLGKLLINVDVVNSLVYRPGDLTALAMAFLNRNNIRQLDQISPQDFRRLKSHLKGVNVTVVTSRTGRGRPIKDLVLNAGGYEFEKDGAVTTVRAHYQQAHNRPLQHPRIFGVRIGRDAVIPAELCRVLPGQLYRKKIPPEMGADFLKFATQKPDARLKAIEDAVSGKDQLFDYQTSDFVRDARMLVNANALAVSGRVLPVPRIQYGDSKFEQIRDKRGAWNILNKKFLEPGVIPTWAIIVFDDNAPVDAVNSLAAMLRRNLEALGIRDDPPREKHNPYQAAQALDTIAQRATIAGDRGQQISPAIIIVLLPANAPELRRAVKHWGDVTRGIPTQCLRSGKWQKLNDQYINNIALKINAKLGGINSKIDGGLIPQGCMVVGMDVGHPGPGVVTRPSVTSLVASVNWDCTQYVAFSGVQQPRVEMINNLEDMLTRAMTQFALRWKGNYPGSIVFFRDGVSEGEFEKVSQNEVLNIKQILRDMDQINQNGQPILGQKAYKSGALPKITFIVVGKRHHVRFFPRSKQEADGSGNCPPGFIIDDEITNAKYPDYYLQSHSGIQGSKYQVSLLCSRNHDACSYQRLSFNLCHVYASATRSVSIPAPRVCARAENHFPEEMHFEESDTASTTSGRAEFDLARWADSFKLARTNMTRQMYFL